MKHRKLRIAWSVTWGVVAVLLCVLWARSYWWADVLLWRYRAPNAIRTRLCTGRIQIEAIVDEPQYMDVLSESGQVLVEAWEPTFHSAGLENGEPDLSGLDSFAFSFNEHAGIFVPVWTLVVTFGALATAPWLRWSKRFSLRTLLITMTLVAVALGIIVWMSRAG